MRTYSVCYWRGYMLFSSIYTRKPAHVLAEDVETSPWQYGMNLLVNNNQPLMTGDDRLAYLLMCHRTLWDANTVFFLLFPAIVEKHCLRQQRPSNVRSLYFIFWIVSLKGNHVIWVQDNCSLCNASKVDFFIGTAWHRKSYSPRSYIYSFSTTKCQKNAKQWS